MFCNYCGKEIIDTARFCNFCGNPVQRLVPPPIPAPAPVSAPITEPIRAAQSQTVNNIPSGVIDNAAENAIEDHSITAPDNLGSGDFVTNSSDTNNADQKIPDTDIPDTEFSEITPSPEPFAPVDTARQTSSGFGFSSPYSGGSAYPTPNVIPQSGQSVSGTYTVPSSAVVPEQKPKRERKYTLGHIMICLAAVAIMAITAGVFAGLYFSVV